MAKFSTNSKTDILIHLGIILCSLLILFFGFFFLYLPWTTNHGEAITVPDLEGMSYNDAKKTLDKTGLKYEISDSVFVVGLEPLSIIANYPKSGSSVKSNRKIFLTVASVSAPMIKIPNIIGRSTQSGQNQLLSAGLIFEGVERIPALEENTILKIKSGNKELEPGDEVPKGSKITFVVGDGYANQRIDIPFLLGMELDEAELYLLGIGLNIGNVIDEPSSAERGTVVKQRPASGSGEQVRIGSSVDLWISTGEF